MSSLSMGGSFSMGGGFDTSSHAADASLGGDDYGNIQARDPEEYDLDEDFDRQSFGGRPRDPNPLRGNNLQWNGR